MPHPKNRIKLTGDTRMPGRDLDLDLDLDREEDDASMAQPGGDGLQPRIYADGYVPPAQMLVVEEVMVVEDPVAADMQPHGAAALKEKVEERIGPKAARRPWLAIGSAIALGFVVMRMLRH